MIATQEATVTPMTFYWTKYIRTPQQDKNQQREEMIEARLLRSEKYKTPQIEISEYDQITYLQ